MGKLLRLVDPPEGDADDVSWKYLTKRDGSLSLESVYNYLSGIFGDGQFSEDEAVGAIMARKVNRMPAIRGINKLKGSGSIIVEEV